MIEHRLTPWDTRSFGFKTAEIISIDTSDGIEEFINEYAQLESTLVKQGVEFIYTRIDSQDFELRMAIQEMGFYFAESSQLVSRKKIQNFTKQKLPQLTLVSIEDDEIESLKEMLSNSFNFGRFHEDSNLPKELSNRRYYNWVEDLIQQNALIQLGKVGEKIVGLNIQKYNDENRQTDLILAGCGNGYEIYVMSLWNEIISFNKELGAQKIKTLISASNIGVANVYSHYNFKIEQTLFGFHKRLS
jgi:hypothetical protein